MISNEAITTAVKPSPTAHQEAGAGSGVSWRAGRKPARSWSAGHWVKSDVFTGAYFVQYNTGNPSRPLNEALQAARNSSQLSL